jgi:hypothetical protein
MLPAVSGLVDSGWAAWLPLELLDALAAAGGGAAERRALRQRLARSPDAAARERWERFRLVAPSRLDVPVEADGLDETACYELLEGLGLVAGRPPRPVPAPEAVELVLTLDHDDVRELERLRGLREPGGAETPVSALPSLEPAFGGGSVGRNDPCPCGSGRKYKRCHGA